MEHIKPKVSLNSQNIKKYLNVISGKRLVWLLFSDCYPIFESYILARQVILFGEHDIEYNSFFTHNSTLFIHKSDRHHFNLPGVQLRIRKGTGSLIL